MQTLEAYCTVALLYNTAIRCFMLMVKRTLIKNIYGFKEITVCDDEDEAYEYWKRHFNPNPNDCCNLSVGKGK